MPAGAALGAATMIGRMAAVNARGALFLAATLLHAAATLSSLVFSIRSSFAVADPGATLPIRGLGLVARALLLPVLDPAAQWLHPSDPLLFALILANSALAIALGWLITLLLRRAVRAMRRGPAA